MAVAWRASGAIVAAAGTGGGATGLTITAPSCSSDDILIAIILSKSNTSISAPDTTWTSVHASNNTTAQRVSIWWKKATGSAGDFTFTRASENINWYGAIVAFYGANTTVPIDGTSPTANPTSTASDTVSYSTFDPAFTSLLEW